MEILKTSLPANISLDDMAMPSTCTIKSLMDLLPFFHAIEQRCPPARPNEDHIVSSMETALERDFLEPIPLWMRWNLHFETSLRTLPFFRRYFVRVRSSFARWFVIYNFWILDGAFSPLNLPRPRSFKEWPFSFVFFKLSVLIILLELLLVFLYIFRFSLK